MGEWMIRTATLPLVFVLTIFASALTLAGCGDECQTLADKICQCEPGVRQQEACRLDYQTQQQNQPAPSATQLEACGTALLTCTCDALDENRTDMCGFTRAEEP